MPEETADILQDRRVIIGLSGGIAAYKACGLVTSLRKRGAVVRVVMTESATQFVSPTTFASLSGHEVAVQMFGEPFGDELQHVHLQDFGEVMLIAPATANLLGKVAAGIADDLLNTTIMAATYPVIFAPAMNWRMWENPVVLRNVATLQELGYGFVMPESGRLASGAVGTGRLAGEEHLLAAVEAALRGQQAQQDLQGKRIVVSAGPTREAIDPVRFISNRSSGRMGYALATEAQRRGAEVTLVSGPSELTPPSGVSLVRVTTTAEMKDAALEAVKEADAYLSAAAPADYRPAVLAERKIKKGESLTLELEQTDDILLAVGRQARPRVLVGFAAETGEAVETARPKLECKDLDLLVVNDVAEPGAGFEVATNRVTLLWRDGRQQALPLMSKQAVAAAILDEVTGLL